MAVSVKLPKFWKQTLANGAKVIGAQNTEIPTVTFSLTVPGGHLVLEEMNIRRI